MIQEQESQPVAERHRLTANDALHRIDEARQVLSGTGASDSEHGSLNALQARVLAGADPVEIVQELEALMGARQER